MFCNLDSFETKARSGKGFCKVSFTPIASLTRADLGTNSGADAEMIAGFLKVTAFSFKPPKFATGGGIDLGTNTGASRAQGETGLGAGAVFGGVVVFTGAAEGAVTAGTEAAADVTFTGAAGDILGAAAETVSLGETVVVGAGLSSESTVEASEGVLTGAVEVACVLAQAEGAGALTGASD